MPEVNLIESLAKILPVKQIYEDALQGGVRQVGYGLEDVVKTLRAAFPFIQEGAVYQDRYRRFLEDSVSMVPEERRIPPVPQILGPVMEGIRYEPEGTDIEAMFKALLSASIDSERVEKAHPAFPSILRSMSHHEAALLKQAAIGEYLVRITYHNDPHAEPPQTIEAVASGFGSVPEHLLGVSESRLRDLNLFDSFEVSSRRDNLSHNREIIYTERRLFPSRFGLLFLEACLPGYPMNWGASTPEEIEMYLSGPRYLEV